MQEVQRGTLLIADIGGYTNFLTAVELQHSTDILSDLIGAIVSQASGAFTLAKLEGDAVFCYAPEGSVDGPAFLTVLESCYFAFVERLRDIAHGSSCECGACRLTPSLNLKFVATFGEWAVHQVAGSTELVGGDVIAVHRLLKNHVVESTGIKGYAFLTAGLVEALGLVPAESELRPHEETYDDVGSIPGFVLDLDGRWQDHQREQRVFVERAEAAHITSQDMPAPPAVVWDWLNSPTKMRQWGADEMTGVARASRRGVGTTNHCVHGNQKVVKRVLDWKPFDYFTEVNSSGPVEMIGTFELTPLEGDRTHLEFRIKPAGTLVSRTLFKLFGGSRMREGDRHFAQLAVLLGDAGGVSAEPSIT